MRDLSKIFSPKTVAIIGASAKEKSVGAGLVKNALQGRQSSNIFLVNPNQQEIFGIKTYPKISDIQGEIDLAIIAVPAALVSQVMAECCEKKVGAIMVVSAGFSEIGAAGQAKQQEILEKAKNAGIPLVGPNCLGVINTADNLNASFAPVTPDKGNMGIISQSGALLDIVMDSADNLGISFAVSYGNEADVKMTDFLEWVADDERTKVLALYIESIPNGREFMEVASRITKIKPIVAIKAGKFPSISDTVKSHTGAMAGDYQVYKAVLRQTGIVEAGSIEELIDITKLLAWQPKCKNLFAIVTNGGGCGVLASDHCKEYGINLAKLSEQAIEKISGFSGMSPYWSKSNPLDIVGDASPERYRAALEAVLSQADVAGAIVIQAPQIMTNPVENAKAIVELKEKYPKKPIICFFLGGKISEDAIKYLEDNKIPNYSDLKRGIIAVKALVEN